MAVIPEDTLSDWLQRIKVDEPLTYNDPKYIPLYDRDDGIILRGRNMTHDLFKTIRLNKREATCQLFSGYVGTGKTTELKRLENRLRKEGYQVLFVDFGDYHDLNHGINMVDFIVLIAGAFGEAVARETGVAIKESYWDRFKNLLNTELKVKTSKTVVGTIEFKSTLRHGDAAIWRDIQRLLDVSLGKVKDNAHDFIRTCQEQLKIKNPHSAGTVFILDSLERLRGDEHNFPKVMQSVIGAFVDHSEFMRLPDCHSIYTIPPYVGFYEGSLARRYDGRNHKPLPAIKVCERHREEGQDIRRYEPGIDVLIELLGKRLPLTQIFGEDRQQLRDLAFYSGGHLKTLLMFMKDLLFDQSGRPFPPAPDVLERIFREFAESANQTIRPEDLPALEILRQTHSIEDIPREQLHTLARFIDSQLVLCYQNGEGWYQLHPLIEKDVARRAGALKKDGST